MNTFVYVRVSGCKCRVKCTLVAQVCMHIVYLCFGILSTVHRPLGTRQIAGTGHLTRGRGGGAAFPEVLTFVVLYSLQMPPTY